MPKFGPVARRLPHSAASFVSSQRSHVGFWHIALFRGTAEFGRYRGTADIDQAAP